MNSKSNDKCFIGIHNCIELLNGRKHATHIIIVATKIMTLFYMCWLVFYSENESI